MPGLAERIRRLEAEQKQREELRKPAPLLAQGAPSSENPIFAGEGPSAEEYLAGESNARIQQILAGNAPDNIAPVEVRETTGLQRILDDAGKGTGSLNPIRALAPLYRGGKAAANFVNEMTTKPLSHAVAPLIGGQDLRGLPEGVANFGDPQAPSARVTAATGGVTPREKASGILQTAANVAFPGATRAVEGMALDAVGPGLASRIIGSAGGAGAVMGAQGAAEGALAPATTPLERGQNIISGGARGVGTGVATGAALHFLAEGMPATAALAARGTKEAAKSTVDLLADFSLDPKKMAEARAYRRIFSGLDEDLAAGRKAPEVHPWEGVRAPRGARAATPEEIGRNRARGARAPEPLALAPRPDVGENIPAGDISSRKPWPTGSVSSADIFSPENLAKFEATRQEGRQGDPELRARIQAGEDLSDAEVHQAEPNNLTIYDVVDQPHPTKPGTSIAAEVKRNRIRLQNMLPPRTAAEPLAQDLDPAEVISGLEKTRKAKGGNEFGDVNDVIKRVKADQENGIPLTLGRLRVHQRDAMLEHGQEIAKDHGIELKRDGVVVILAGPPGSGKSTIANRVGKALGAYQVDADFAKLRDPRYQDVGASGVHEESSEIALRAKNLAIARRDNIVVPMIGKDPKYIRQWMQELKDSGHKVYYVLADLSPEEASVRAFNRSLGKGRVVGPDYVLNSVARKPQHTFDTLKADSDLTGGRFVRLDQSHPQTVPLLNRVLEHGPGFDLSLIDENAALDGGGSPGPVDRPGGGAEPAPEGRVDRGVPRTDLPAHPPGDVPQDVDLFGAPVETKPAGPEPWKTQEVKVSDLSIDPHRFQYKQDVDPTTGEGAHLKSAKEFDKRFAGIIDVWHDPANGKDYVVNGHHRFQLAKRSGTETVTARWIDAPDWQTARAFGALKNIAGGRGTALDVAKFMADTGTTLEDLSRENIAIKAGVARDGAALARLPQDLLRKVYQDPTLTRKAAIIGETLDAEDQQRAAFREAGKLTERQTEELTRVIRAAGSEEIHQEDMFGARAVEKALYVEKAKLAAAMRERLGKDKRLFGYVANEGRAAALERGGNKISVEKSKEIAQQSAQLEELFDRLYSRGGPIGKLMDAGARRISHGEKAGVVASDLYEQIRGAVQDEAPLKRAGRAGANNEGAGLELGGLSGSGLGSVAGGTIGGQIGNTPEERRRNAAAGAAIGLGVGGAAGAFAGRKAFGGARSVLERVFGPTEGAPREAPIFAVEAKPERVSVRIKGKPSIDQLNDLLTAMRKNPKAGFRYVLRDLNGRQVSAGNRIWDLWSDLPHAISNEPLARTGAAGDQPNLFGEPEGPDQGALFGADEGRVQQARSSTFAAKQEEAKLNADFLRKQLARITDDKARAKLAATIADLDQIANFDAKITEPELATRAAAERSGAAGNQPPKRVYHGTQSSFDPSKDGPTFFAESPEAVDFYANAKKSLTKGRIIEAELNIKNPLDITTQEGAKKLVDIAEKEGVKTGYREDEHGWTMDAREVSDHSPYDGTQPDDLLYIPRVRKAVLAAGYDGIKTTDVVSRDESPAWIALSGKQVKVVNDNFEARSMYNRAGAVGAQPESPFGASDKLREESFAQYHDRLRDRNAERRRLITEHIGPFKGPVAFDGGDGRYSVLSRSTRKPGMLQLSRFDTSGQWGEGIQPLGHEEYYGLPDAIDAITASSNLRPTTELGGAMKEPGGWLRNKTGAVGAQPDRGAYLGESDLLNVSKIVDTESAQERVAQAAEKYRGQRDLQKKTWAETDPEIKKAVNELLAEDPKARAPHIARKLTGVQLLARRDVIRQNDTLIEDLSKKLASGTLTVAEHENATQLMGKAVQHNDALLSDLITGASQKGRDLNLLRRIANKSLDHDVWQIQAKRMLGDRPLTDELSAQLRRLVNEAQEVCGG